MTFSIWTFGTRTVMYFAINDLGGKIMKLRNKFEKAVLAESKNLRPITKMQSKWAFRACIDHFAYRLPKGRITCMDCGHSWTIEKTTEHCTCPHCRAKLQVRTTFERKIRQKQYFTILTTCGEYQVLRMFLLSAERMQTNVLRY